MAGVWEEEDISDNAETDCDDINDNDDEQLMEDDSTGLTQNNLQENFFASQEGDKRPKSKQWMNLVSQFPSTLKWEEARTQWKSWIYVFDRLLKIENFSQMEMETYLLAKGGTKIAEIHARPAAPGEITCGQDVPCYDNLVKRCTYYFEENAHKGMDIGIFRAAKQKEDETLSDFATRMRKMGELCGFPNLEDEVKMKLLYDSKLKSEYEKQVMIWDKTPQEIERFGILMEQLIERNLKSASNDISKQASDNEAAVSALRNDNRSFRNSEQERDHRSRPYSLKRPYENKNYERGGQYERREYRDYRVDKCGYCNGNHRNGNCPAYGKDCKNCGKKNHFEAACRFKKEDKVKKEVSHVRDHRYTQVKQGNDSD